MSKKMKIAILGSRGIPNKYGGFEQFAEYLSKGLVAKGHSVTVYNPDFHPYQENSFEGVDIIHKWCPENKFGSAAHFIYDYICLRDALKKNFNIILELGYQSAAISYFLCDIDKSVVVTNMDGLEWKRDKWSPFVKKMTLWFEKLGATKSHYLVSDNEGIQTYLKTTYGKESVMIPYGAELFDTLGDSVLHEYVVEEEEYYLLIARLEPENNIETILDGYVLSADSRKFLVVGNHETAYGEHLKEKYRHNNVKFVGGIYDIYVLNNLRWYARLYFHGHSVGGTNPSLLEAMASHAFICAHENEFNASVLGDGTFYFQTVHEVAKIIDNYETLKGSREEMILKNTKRIGTTYNWEKIIEEYETMFEGILSEHRHHHTR